MENKRKPFLKNLGSIGQSAVEYILLLSVVTSMALAVYKSSFFKKMFGENSSMFDALRKRMEYNYRYTQDGREDTMGMDYGGQHASYYAPSGSASHYFMPKTKY